MPKVFFRSNPTLIVSPPEEELFSAEVGNFQVFEETERVQPRQTQEHAVMYSVRIESDVGTVVEALRLCQQAGDLIHDLERVWVYVMGEPMRPVRQVVEIYHGPDGWETNFSEVKESLHAKESNLRATVKITNRHWIKTPCWPLRHALAALQPYRMADEEARTLMDLHFHALQSTRQEGQLFYLAKGLELARDLLPGGRLEQKERALDQNAQPHLTRPLRWLYDMSNNRAETRHIVRGNSPTTTLHAPMTREELRAYENNADIVIRAVVSRCLGIDCVILSRHTSA